MISKKIICIYLHWAKQYYLRDKMTCELSAENNVSAKQQSIHQETHLHWSVGRPTAPVTQTWSRCHSVLNQASQSTYPACYVNTFNKWLLWLRLSNTFLIIFWIILQRVCNFIFNFILNGAKFTKFLFRIKWDQLSLNLFIILSFNNTYGTAITTLGTRDTRNACSLKEMSKVGCLGGSVG